MEFLVINEIAVTDDELIQSLGLGLLLLHSGALTRAEHCTVAKAVDRIESLICARKFVRRLMAEIDKLDV